MNGSYKENSWTREKASVMTTILLLSNTLTVHDSQSGITRKKRHARIEIQTTDGLKTAQNKQRRTTRQKRVIRAENGALYRKQPFSIHSGQLHAYSLSSQAHTLYKPSSCAPPYLYDAALFHS